MIGMPFNIINRSVVGENLSQFLVLFSIYLLWIKSVSFQSRTTSIENNIEIKPQTVCDFQNNTKVLVFSRDFRTGTYMPKNYTVKQFIFPDRFQCLYLVVKSA